SVEAPLPSVGATMTRTGTHGSTRVAIGSRRSVPPGMSMQAPPPAQACHRYENVTASFVAQVPVLVRKTVSLAVTTGALSSAGPTRTSAQSSGTVSYGPSVTVTWWPPPAGTL